MKMGADQFEEIEPEIIAVAPHQFIFGDIWGDGEPDELPPLAPTLNKFVLGRFAVSVRQFVAFLNDYGSRYDPDGNVMVSLADDESPLVYDAGKFQCKRSLADYPINYVSWFGAKCYAEWLSEKSGRRYVLPSEAQWQCASMGAEGWKWSHGNQFDRSEYITASDGPGPINYGCPSPSGFYNLTGNVFEWCQDEYRFSLGNESVKNTLLNNRVIKGGSFILADADNFRNAKRFSCDQGSCLSSIGFRVAALPDE